MPWPFVESELDNLNVLAWVTPPALVVSYIYLPAPLDSAFLIAGVIGATIQFARRSRRWFQQLLVLAWGVIPLAFPYVEA